MKILLKVIDYIISAFMGAVTVLLVFFIIGRSWNMFMAMIVGMFLGMAVLFISLLLFIYVTTAFELFATGMVITMVTGMVSAMIVASFDPDIKLILTGAVIFSLTVQLGIDLYDMKLRGDVLIDE